MNPEEQKEFDDNFAEITKKRIFNAIRAERSYQDLKAERLKWNPNKTLAEFLLIIEHETAEAKQGWIKGSFGRDHIAHEILQIAAVCVAALETLSKDQQEELMIISLRSKERFDNE